MAASLLGDLWGDAGRVAGGAGDGVEGVREECPKVVIQEMTYAQVVASSSSEDGGGTGKLGRKRRMGPSPDQRAGGQQLAGSKRPRSPKDKTCGRCFRSSHKTSECRHQVVCLRCAGVGHVAARCQVALRRSPRRKRLHVRSKLQGSQEETSMETQKPFEVAPSLPGAESGEGLRGQRPRRMAISLPLTPEMASTREELAKIAVLSLVSGYVNECSILEIVPSIINLKLAGPITPLNECSFLVPLANREEVKEVSKMGTFAANTKDGPCTLRIAPWSAELGAEGRASGEGSWVLIWNLPLHAWSWNVILEVLRPVGELVAISQATVPHKRFITVLVRRRFDVKLPLELDLSLGMRRYPIIFTGERAAYPSFRRDLGRYVLEEERAGGEEPQKSERKGTHEIPLVEKGKKVQGVQSSLGGASGAVERVSRPMTGDPRPERLDESRPHAILRNAGVRVGLTAPVERCSRAGETLVLPGFGSSGCSGDPVDSSRRSGGPSEDQVLARSSECSRTVRCDESSWRGSRHQRVERWQVRKPYKRSSSTGFGDSRNPSEVAKVGESEVSAHMITKAEVKRGLVAKPAAVVMEVSKVKSLDAELGHVDPMQTCTREVRSVGDKDVDTAFSSVDPVVSEMGYCLQLG